VIIVETPGAIAELGAFCMDEALIPRLFCIVDDSHKKESFIHLGPINKITDTEPGAICIVESLLDWQSFAAEIKGFASAFGERVIAAGKKTSWDKFNNGHLLIAILDLIDLFEVVNFQELKTLLESMGASVDAASLKRMLWTLGLLDTIEKKQVYTKAYYTTKSKLNLGGNYLDFSAIAPEKFDRIAFRMKFIRPWIDNDPIRLKAKQSNGGLK
jgi:hypothetical protein